MAPALDCPGPGVTRISDRALARKQAGAGPQAASERLPRNGVSESHIQPLKFQAPTPEPSAGLSPGGGRAQLRPVLVWKLHVFSTTAHS